MKRGEIWVWSRFGHEHKVLVVGEDGLTAQRLDVLVVPISDVLPPAVMMPHVVDLSGKPLGVATVARVGPVRNRRSWRGRESSRRKVRRSST